MNNSITMTLTDSTHSVTYEMLEVPLTEQIVEGARDVQTIDGNVSTYFTFKKRQWRHRWAFMSEDEYLELRGFFDRQQTKYRFPVLSIPRLNVNTPVRLSINDRNIVNNCGRVRNVDITMRETRQNAQPGGA